MITTQAWLDEIDRMGFTISYETNKTYNPETHELIEKPEAKKIRLEEELNLIRVRIEAQNTTLEAANLIIYELKKEKDKIEKELED